MTRIAQRRPPRTLSRRAQADMMVWISRLLLLVVATITIALLVRYFAHREVDDASLHRTSYLYRIYYDGELVTYRDPSTGRVYPGVIDYDKFAAARLDEVFGTHGRISSTLTLKGSCVEDTVIYHDRRTYEEKAGFARYGTIGPGGATLQEEILPVTIEKGDGRCQGMLNVSIVRANS